MYALVIILMAVVMVILVVCLKRLTRGTLKTKGTIIDIDTDIEVRIHEVYSMPKSHDLNIPSVAVNIGIVWHITDLFMQKFGRFYTSKDVSFCKSCRRRRYPYAVLESNGNSVFTKLYEIHESPGFHLDNKIFLSKEAAQELGIAYYKNIPYSVKASKFLLMCEEEATTFAYVRSRAKDNADNAVEPLSEILKGELDEILRKKGF